MNEMTSHTSLDTLLERRKRLLGSAYRLFYERPLHIVRGEGVWLEDAAGQRYLDCYNNVPHVGHCHPRVVRAICDQAARLNTHTRYLHESVLDYAERLTAYCPGSLGVAMFACSGTEANELALRIARAASGGDGMIVTENAYHGNSWAIAQVSPTELPAAQRGDNVVTVPAPDVYRGRYRGEDAGQRYAECLRDAIAQLAERGHRLAAFMVDTVMSSDGIPGVLDGWLARSAEIVRDAGGLLVADEVQAGFGRTGTNFWGFENHAVTPDLITMGKPMGNGHPISAVVASPTLIEAFSASTGYFNTFGGNPVSCAAAGAVLEVMESQGLQRNALEVGEYIKAGVADLAARHAIVGDIRGTGLFLGIDLITDRETRGPAGAAARRVHNAMRERGVLLGTTGPHENVLKIRPPMVFSRDNADLLLDRLDEVLGQQGGAISQKEA